MSRAMIALLVCLSLSTAALAEDLEKAAIQGDEPTEPAAAAAASGQEKDFHAPVPAAEMDQMRKWEGSWKTVATFAKGGMMPEGGEAKGTYTSVRGLNGHAFIGDYKASGTGGDFAGHGVRMWDQATKKWKTWWYDSWVPGHADLSIGEVGSDGTFITESDSEYQGNKFKMRITERWTDDNKVEQAFESDLGKGWTAVMSIAYSRKGKWKEKPAAGEKSERKARKKKDKAEKSGEKSGKIDGAKSAGSGGVGVDDKADAAQKDAGEKPKDGKNSNKKDDTKPGKSGKEPGDDDE